MFFENLSRITFLRGRGKCIEAKIFKRPNPADRLNIRRRPSSLVITKKNFLIFRPIFWKGDPCAFKKIIQNFGIISIHKVIL